MKLRSVLSPTNRKVRLLVGLFLAGLLAIQCTRTEAWKESAGVTAIGGNPIGDNSSLAATIDKLARTDHIALLDMSLRNCQAKYHDFTCTFSKQEVINGSSKGLQVIEAKHMESPFSVAMTWVKNPPLGDKLIYVEGKYDNQMLVRPTSVIARVFLPVAVRPPDDPEALKNTLRPINMFGFDRGMKSLLEVYRAAKAAGDLKESFGGYARVSGRSTVVLIRRLPDAPEYRMASAKTVIFLDTDYLVPIRIEGYDADGIPSSAYEYSNVKFNLGLTGDDFLPENNDMKSPK